MNSALWKTFLKPGWVLTTVAVLVFAYVAFTVLAPWQLHKNEATTSRNHQIEQAFATDPVAYSEVFNPSGAVAVDEEWRRVQLTGHYLPESEVLLRLRPVNSAPAYHALTPFQIDNGPVVLINRGFVPVRDGVAEGSAPPITPAPNSAESVSVVGYARLNETAPTAAPLVEQQPPQVMGINTEQVSDVTGVRLAQDYVQLSPHQPGVLSPIPLPQLDAGPHLSYGVQWIAFGIMAPLGLGYFVWAEMRERRRELAEQTPTNPEAPQGDGTTSGAASRAGAEGTPKASSKPKTRSRYGGARRDHYSKIAKRNEERF